MIVTESERGMLLRHYVDLWLARCIAPDPKTAAEEALSFARAIVEAIVTKVDVSKDR